MEVKITLKIETSQSLETSKYLLVATITDSTDIFPQVFLFHRTMDGTDEFVSVACAAEIAQYPRGNPVEGNPFFLKDTCSFEKDTAKEMFDLSDEIQYDVQKLATDWQLLEGQVTQIKEIEIQG